MILVTGATGLVGSHLVLELLKIHPFIKALRREKSNTSQLEKIFSCYSSNPKELLKRIIWTEGDILDYESIEKSMVDIEQVYHTAALVSFNPSDKYMIMKNNIKGTANIVNICLAKGINKLCHVSSIASLGSSIHGNLIDEKTIRNRFDSHSFYSLSKYHSELEVWRGITEGLNAVIINPSVILGVGDWTKGSSNFFLTVWKGLNFYTNGVTGFVDVKDVVQSAINLMQSNISNERFIISSENISYKDFFTMIAENLHKKPPSWYASPTLSEIAWRMDYLKNKIFRTKPLITKETAKSAHKQSFYNNQKIVETTNFVFNSIENTVKEICDVFRKDFV